VRLPPAVRRALASRAGHLTLALLAGLALPLTLAPFDLWWLGPVIVAALLWLLWLAPDARAGFWTGWAYGVGKFGLGVSWIYVSIHEYGHASPLLAGFLVALFVAALALFHGIFGWLFVAGFGARRPAAGVPVPDARSALGFAGLWLLLDWVFTWVLTGFPWLLLGYGHLDSPLAGYAPLLGVHGVTAAVVASGVLLALLVRPEQAAGPRSRRWLVPLLLTTLWGVGWLARQVPHVQPLVPRDVALVQGNIPQDTKWNPAFVQRTLDTYVGLSTPHEDADILLWPEAAVTMLLEDAGPFLDEMGRRTSARGGALVTGIVSWRRETGIRNLTVVVGRGEGVYTKRRLVPFGEYVPLEGLLRGLIGFFDLPMSHTEPGAPVQPLLRVGEAKIAMAICYEVVYPDLVREQARDANLLATVSNDTWFGASIGPLQHLQMARMRALELGRFMLRATNNGVTAVIDARGRVVAQLPQFAPGVLRGQVWLMAGDTPYARFGDVPVLALLAGLLAAGWRGRRRSEQGAQA
jgi:apolipoprotein N-acyltransferase